MRTVDNALAPYWPASGDGIFPWQHALNNHDTAGRSALTSSLNSYAALCHAATIHWWHDPATGEPIKRNKGELMMMIVSELSEAMEDERKDLPDDHLPHRRMAEVELVDALIRLFGYAGAFGYLGGAFREKMAYNSQRADHKPEARLAKGGKKW